MLGSDTASDTNMNLCMIILHVGNSTAAWCMMDGSSIIKQTRWLYLIQGCVSVDAMISID